MRRSIMQNNQTTPGDTGKSHPAPVIRSYKSNFTIIELMIVISIIAIIASLLLPALAKVREKAQSIQCISNQKTLSLAMLNYADSFDGWGRIYGLGNSTDKDQYYATRYFFGPVSAGRFPMTLLPYTDTGRNCIVADDTEFENHDTAPFAVCPSGRRDGNGITAPNDGNLPNFSYSFNSRLCFPLSQLGSKGYNRMSSVKRPSGRVLLADFSCVKDDGTTTYGYRSMHLMAQGNIARRHNNYANITFVDGHVESWISAKISIVSQASASTHPNVSFWADYK